MGFITLSEFEKKGGDPSLPSSFPEEERENIVYPDPVIVPLLVEALDQLDAGISLRAAADWYNDRLAEIEESSSSRVSHAGLKKIWDRERPDHPVRDTRVRTPKLSTRIPREKRVRLKKRIKIGREKVRIKAAAKRIQKYEEELSQYEERKRKEKERVHIEVPTEFDFSDVIEDEEIKPIFTPNPGPQAQFLSASELEVLYGGAAGG